MFGFKKNKSDICLIEFLIVFQESVIFCCFPTSVRSMYSKRHLGYCTVYHNKVRHLGYVTPLMTPFRVCFTGVTPFRGVNLMCRNTPFRVHFWDVWTRMGITFFCEWPPRVCTRHGNATCTLCVALLFYWLLLCFALLCRAQSYVHWWG